MDRPRRGRAAADREGSTSLIRDDVGVLPTDTCYAIALRDHKGVGEGSHTDLDRNPLTVIETGDWVKVDADRGVVEVRKAPAGRCYNPPRRPADNRCRRPKNVRTASKPIR